MRAALSNWSLKSGTTSCGLPARSVWPSVPAQLIEIDAQVAEHFAASGSDRMKGEAFARDVVAEIRAGGDDRIVTVRLEAQGNGDEGMQVAERPQRRENDSGHGPSV